MFQGVQDLGHGGVVLVCARVRPSDAVQKILGGYLFGPKVGVPAKQFLEVSGHPLLISCTEIWQRYLELFLGTHHWGCECCISLCVAECMILRCNKDAAAEIRSRATSNGCRTGEVHTGNVR